MAKRILYRMFSDDGELLYVGATVNPALRMRAHAQVRDWWEEVGTITLERGFSTLEALAAAELKAIKTEGPKYNLQHAQPATWSRKPRRSDGCTLFQRSSDKLWIGGVTVNGQQKRVSSRDREECLRKLEKLREKFDGTPESTVTAG